MFDISGVISRQVEGCNISYRGDIRLEYARNINFSSSDIKGKFFKCIYLERDNEDMGYCKEDGLTAVLLGDAYLNNSYSQITGRPPYRCSAGDISSLFKEHGAAFINNVKGSFLIYIFDENNQKFYLFNSRFGLLDTYYFYEKKQKTLFFATSAETILRNATCDRRVNDASIIETAIFGYPLGTESFFKEIKSVPPGSSIEFDLDEINIHAYFDHTSFFRDRRPVVDFDGSYQRVGEVFNKVVSLYTSDQKRYCCSLTGGFDSRALVSALNLNKKDILFYSWGIPGCYEIRIPQIIADGTHLNYRPVLLDASFEKEYEYFALQALFWSDGRAPFSRANHTYGYNKLSAFSDKVITGLFGSELIKPANVYGITYNRNFITVLYADNQEEAVSNLLKTEQKRGILREGYVRKHTDAVLEHILPLFEKLKEVEPKYLQPYCFNLMEGFRKYFGHEIHTCRLYGHIRSPYIDEDLVRAIILSSLPDLNIYAFKRKLISRKKAQLFYTYLIKKNNGALLNFITNRMYKPTQLESQLFPVNVFPNYLYLGVKYRLLAGRVFDNKRWSQPLCKKTLKLLSSENEIFTGASGCMRQWKGDDYSLKLFSLGYWIDKLTNGLQEGKVS